MLAFFNLLKCRAWAYGWVSCCTAVAVLYSHLSGNGDLRMAVVTFALCCLVCVVASAAPALARLPASARRPEAPETTMEEDRRRAKNGDLPIEDYLERWGEQDFAKGGAAPTTPRKKPRLFLPVPPDEATKRLAEIQARIADGLDIWIGESVRMVDSMAGIWLVVGRGTLPGTLRIRRADGANVWQREIEPRMLTRVIHTKWVPRAEDGKARFAMPDHYPQFPPIPHNDPIQYRSSDGNSNWNFKG